MAAPQLSPHLSEAEFLHTGHDAFVDEQARRWAEDPSLRASAERFAATVFEPVRELLGPLVVTSGYRCPALNTVVGGRPASKHTLALAVDCYPVSLSNIEAMHKLVLAFDAGALERVDEVILELGWIHLQAAPLGARPRRLALQTSDRAHFVPFDRTLTG